MLSFSLSLSLSAAATATCIRKGGKTARRSRSRDAATHIHRMRRRRLMVMWERGGKSMGCRVIDCGCIGRDRVGDGSVSMMDFCVYVIGIDVLGI